MLYEFCAENFERVPVAIKAGADTTVALHRFDSITTDTLVAMATVAAQ